MKNKRKLNTLGLTRSLLICVCLIGIAACSSADPQSPETAIKATLSSLEEAAEARTLSGFMEHISKDYRDHEGRNWDDIQRLVQFHYLRNQRIHIYTDITEMNVAANTASVEINAAMASRAEELNLLDGSVRANTHHFSVVLTGSEDAQTWQVVSVAWRRGWQ